MSTYLLVAESDSAFASVVNETFSLSEYDVKVVWGLEEAVMEIEKRRPDILIVSDELDGGRGMELCQIVEGVKGKAETPAIVFLTARSERTKSWGSGLCMDARLSRPVDPIRLKSAVESLLVRRTRQAQINPLTKLPGPAALAKEIESRRRAGESFSLCTFTLAAPAAAAYQEKYGELKFTAMIKQAARSISICALDLGGGDAFVAHSGTPDEPEFAAIVPTKKAEEFCKAALEEFMVAAELLYDATDREDGSLVTSTDSGERLRVPFVSLSADVSTESPLTQASGV